MPMKAYQSNPYDLRRKWRELCKSEENRQIHVDDILEFYINKQNCNIYIISIDDTTYKVFTTLSDWLCSRESNRIIANRLKCVNPDFGQNISSNPFYTYTYTNVIDRLKLIIYKPLTHQKRK